MYVENSDFSLPGAVSATTFAEPLQFFNRVFRGVYSVYNLLQGGQIICLSFLVLIVYAQVIIFIQLPTDRDLNTT